jgi:hypothetical protein
MEGPCHRTQVLAATIDDRVDPGDCLSGLVITRIDAP